ncbi:hypothetical protein AKJ39_02460 [candidate division MSBL1 archaeon SCGC-AAA259J03]|uniref:Uncharacterized protein n=1 Tax=candidate division MSBL1 archaeon SCGC-AAA259J03 TaxID=1698269 RepID=A0A656YWJ6_9EURY|nr:hypothetical protein AKJ39_02460 [candidate division MSBL1 archaeon SCGC-AAA259J03]
MPPPPKIKTKKKLIENMTDISCHGSSRTTSQRKKVKTLLGIVRDLADVHEEWIPLSAVKDKAEAANPGITPAFVDEFVEKESREGRLLVRDEDGQREVSLNE